MTSTMSEDETQVRVILARLEGKLDANLAAHGGDIATLKANDADKEVRLRTQEARRTISPQQLWAGIATAVGTATGLATLIRVFWPAT